MYYIVYPILYLASLIPFFILYGFSDLLAFLLHRVFKYRRDVVLGNLLIAFPEKTQKEREEIAKRFYSYFTDSFIEILKMISISKKELQKRNTGSYDLINDLIAKGKSINMLCGHQFNWEYGNLLYSSKLDFPMVTIYLPVNSDAMNRIMVKIRSRFGTTMVSPNEFGNRMHSVFKKQHALVLIADQSPAVPTSGYWINFFGRPTNFLYGPEKSAIRNKVAVVFFNYKKIKRGYFHYEPILLTENAADIPERGRVTCLYRDELEKSIRNDPANYLWTHRRFKFEWKPEYGKKIE